jgi:hypothetical protein
MRKDNIYILYIHIYICLKYTYKHTRDFVFHRLSYRHRVGGIRIYSIKIHINIHTSIYIYVYIHVHTHI